MFTKQKIKTLIIWLSVMLVLTSLCVFHSSWNPALIKLLSNRFNIVSNRNNMLVHFISVGEADAVAINLPDGKVMLIDAGLQSTNVTYTNYLKHHVLNNSTDDTIDYLILTHAHTDHTGGAMRLIKNFDVDKIFLPELMGESKSYTELYNYVTENCNYEYLSSDLELSGKNYDVEIFGPLSYSNLNDSCPLIRLEYLDKSFLFTGDVTSIVETKMIEQFGLRLDSDVLKVAHHGSAYSTSDEFLEVVSPEYAVISVGYNNNGHPTDVVLENIKEANATCLRTDINGNVLFVVGEDYNLTNINGSYWITNFPLDYRYIILIINAIIVVKLVIIVVKKEKRKR